MKVKLIQLLLSTYSCNVLHDISNFLIIRKMAGNVNVSIYVNTM